MDRLTSVISVLPLELYRTSSRVTLSFCTTRSPAREPGTPKLRLIKQNNGESIYNLPINNPVIKIQHFNKIRTTILSLY